MNPTQLSQYEVRCTTPSAIGPSLMAVTVEVNGLSSSNNLTFTYQAPVINSIQPLGPFNVTGQETVRIMGYNFGVCSSNCPSLSVSIGSYSCTNPLRISDSELRCLTQAGIGGYLPIVVTANGFSSTPATIFSYKRPVVTQISPNTAGSAAFALLTIKGNNFGITTSPVNAYFRNSNTTVVCLNPAWITNEVITCITPDTLPREIFSIVVEVGGQESQEAGVSYSNLNYLPRPEATNVAVNMEETESEIVQLYATDYLSLSLEYRIESLPEKGVLFQFSPNAPGNIGNQITAVPTILGINRVVYRTIGFLNGNDVFTYSARNEKYFSPPATVRIRRRS